MSKLGADTGGLRCAPASGVAGPFLRQHLVQRRAGDVYVPYRKGTALRLQPDLVSDGLLSATRTGSSANCEHS